ncbi:sigma-70 family RNA polymerase sigma factor [Cytophagaceae bacterium ABcell3]|nr:sigma-70 family RNA polymerase sigma factor [Cytophagaceae bacterium ABcell3]
MRIIEENIPELIIKGADEKVIPLLYKKVLPAVEKHIVSKSGRKEDAFDVFQDALLLFYKQVVKKTYNPKYKVYGYVYRISINLWLNKIKRDKKIQLTDQLPDSKGEEQIEIKEELFALEEDNIIKAIFAEIGEKCIELLTHTIYYGMPYKEVMEKMGFPSIAAVKMQQKRCKEKLVKEIEKKPHLEDLLKGL